MLLSFMKRTLYGVIAVGNIDQFLWLHSTWCVFFLRPSDDYADDGKVDKIMSNSPKCV